MNIDVIYVPSTTDVHVELPDHDCYEDGNYSVEQYEFYNPTPQQVDEGTDHDEIGYVAICNVCGAEMPRIDAYPEEPDYD